MNSGVCEHDHATTDSPSAVIPCPVADTEKPPKVRYKMTRFNTLKHEILLRLLLEVRCAVAMLVKLKELRGNH